ALVPTDVRVDVPRPPGLGRSDRARPVPAERAGVAGGARHLRGSARSRSRPGHGLLGDQRRLPARARADRPLVAMAEDRFARYRPLRPRHHGPHGRHSARGGRRTDAGRHRGRRRSSAGGALRVSDRIGDAPCPALDPDLVRSGRVGRPSPRTDLGPARTRPQGRLHDRCRGRPAARQLARLAPGRSRQPRAAALRYACRRKLDGARPARAARHRTPGVPAV
ncbi:MAG: Putative transmembrane protein, partial [uncultured Microvirga sp.]